MATEAQIEAAARAMKPGHFAIYDKGYTNQNWLAERRFLNAEKVVKRARKDAKLALEAVMTWQPIETAPRDGREILCAEGELIRVCRPKLFPRPIVRGDDHSKSKPGDRWEIFRDDKHAPGHTWSMTPTHWMPLPDTSVVNKTSD